MRRLITIKENRSLDLSDLNLRERKYILQRTYFTQTLVMTTQVLHVCTEKKD